MISFSKQNKEEVSLTTTTEDPSVVGVAHRMSRVSQFNVSRPIFNQSRFDDSYNEPNDPSYFVRTPWAKLKRRIAFKFYDTFNSGNSCRAAVTASFFRSIPILSWLPRYDVRQNLLKDLIAGLTVGIMNVPQGMAYGKLGLVPHVYGLYTSFFPLLIYTMLGTSRHVSVGTFAVVSLMSSKLVKMYEHRGAELLETSETPGNWTLDADGELEHIPAKVSVLVAVAFCVGIWQIALGLLGLGCLTVYLSDQLVKAFTCGASFHVFTSQLKPIFGLRNLTSHYGSLKLYKTYHDFFLNIGNTHVPTLIVSFICILFLLLVKYAINENKKVMKMIKFPVPAELLVVIFGALISYFVNLRSMNIRTVSTVPMGLPLPRAPDMRLVPDMIFDTFAIAVVGFSITISLGKLFAQRFKYQIYPNQELKALGAASLFGSFFHCLPATGSLARTAVQVAVGGQTQVVSIVAAFFVLGVILFAGKLLEPLPEACLGAIIVVALINMLKQIKEIMRLWHISLIDTSVFTVTLLAVLILDVDSGLGVGVGYCLLTVILRTQRPAISLLGRVPHSDIYKRIESYKSAMEISGIKIVRLDAPLYFANAEYFRRSIYDLCGMAKLIRGESRSSSPILELHASYDTLHMTTPPWNDQEYDPTVCIIEASGDSGTNHSSPEKKPDISCPELTSGIQFLIFDCSAVCYMDVSGVEILEKIALECRAIDIEFLLASCKTDVFFSPDAVRETIFLTGFNKHLGPDNLYLTVHDAVLFAMKGKPMS